MELAEKIESALVAYLQTKIAAAIVATTLPDYFDPDTQVRPGEADEDITQQYVRCRAAGTAESEYPLDTGNFMWDCEVETRTPAALQTDAEEASEELEDSTSQLDKHKGVAGVVETAICVDDLPAQLTAAVSDFTVIAVQDRRPARAQDEDTYSSGWLLRLYCFSSA
jgi:hypothetical protein